MEVLTRENAVTAACVVLAVLAWYGVREYTGVGQPVAYGVLIGVGILLPAVVLYLLPGEDYSS